MSESNAKLLDPQNLQSPSIRANATPIIQYGLPLTVNSCHKLDLISRKIGLITIPKRWWPFHDWLLLKENIANQLAAVAQLDSNMVLYILVGLGSEYDPLMVSIPPRYSKLISFHDLHGLLLTHEHWLLNWIIQNWTSKS